jgi:hypothetical protein
VKVQSAILRILTLTASTIRTLAIHIDWYSSLPLPLPSHLRALTELCIQFNKVLSITAATATSLLTGLLRIVDSDGIMDTIRVIAPSLTHLCLPAYVIREFCHLVALCIYKSYILEDSV